MWRALAQLYELQRVGDVAQLVGAFAIRPASTHQSLKDANILPNTNYLLNAVGDSGARWHGLWHTPERVGENKLFRV